VERGNPFQSVANRILIGVGKGIDELLAEIGVEMDIVTKRRVMH
jgi:hypothetical protein